MIFPEHDRSFHNKIKTDAITHPQTSETKPSADLGTHTKNNFGHQSTISDRSGHRIPGHCIHGKTGAASRGVAGKSGGGISDGVFRGITDGGLYNTQFERLPYESESCLPDRFNIRLSDRMMRTRTHYCRLATPALSIDGHPITCYSLLAFELDELVVTDHVFIFDITRSKKAFERLVRIARREQLSPTQLSYLAEDMIGAGLL